MRRAVSILALIIASSSLFAAYSIVTPESSDGMYMLMNAVGETLPLDDDLYYKEWNGLLAEQLNTGIYKVRDNGESVVIVTKPYSVDLLRYALWSQMDINTVVMPVLDAIEPSELKDSGVTQVITFTEPTELDERFYSLQQIKLDAIDYGDIIDIVDGNAAIDEKTEIAVSCPHCGETFTITL